MKGFSEICRIQIPFTGIQKYGFAEVQKGRAIAQAISAKP
jgi:hypothetical protein